MIDRAPKTSPDRMSREDLEEDVAYLRSELGLAMEAGRRQRLQIHFNLTPTAAAFLLALYSVKQVVLSRDQMIDATRLHGNNEDVSTKGVDVYVWKLRKALGKDAVKSVWGQGYALSVRGIELVSSALRDMERAAA